MARLKDMRIFAAVAEAGSFTAAGRVLDIPKQTVSRRVAQLERDLGVRLLHRTTRSLRTTEVGADYAARCSQLVKLAEEANRSVTSAHSTPSGTLRITADPMFGEAFLAAVVAEYLGAYPAVRVDAMLTQRKVDLIEESFDVAIRVGVLSDSTLVARKLAPARMRYCASPGYLEKRGVPKHPRDLAEHDCIGFQPFHIPVRWRFAGPDGELVVPLDCRVRVNEFAMARQAAASGLGIANIPAFACADDLHSGALAAVLDDWAASWGAIYVVYPSNRFLSARVRAFVDLAIDHFERPASVW